jgi:RNA polymerase sigma-70 factor (ECF subfamily)
LAGLEGDCYIRAALAFIGCVETEAVAPPASGALDETFLDLYDREGTSVLAYLRAAVGQDAEAEDLAAETFLRAWRQWPRFRASYDHPARHWLLRIAHNLVIDRARRLSRVRVVPLGDTTADGRDTGALVADRLQLLSALQSLPQDGRDVMALRAAGLQFAEVAAVVGKTEAATRMAWHRAARRLRDQLER